MGTKHALPFSLTPSDSVRYSPVAVLALSPYYLRPETTIRLAFKFYPAKIVHLDFSNVHLIKAIKNTKKELH